MNAIYQFIPQEIVEAIGWTLFHSIWQIISVAILLAIILASFNKISAAARYIVAYASLAAIALCMSITFIQSYNVAREKAEIRKEILSNPLIVIQHFKESLQKQKNMDAAEVKKATINIQWLLVKSYFQRNFPVMVVIWFSGLLLFLLRFAGGLWYVNRLRYRQLISMDESWSQRIAELSSQLKLKKKVEIFQSQLTQVPLTLGFFKPVILLPVSALTGLSVQHIESIIAHELAHILRLDYFLNIIQSVFEIILFYHPAIWWISSVIRTEREHCCDDIAVQLTGDSIHYAKTLALVQENVLMQQSLAMAFGANKNQLFNRIKRILNPKTMKNNFTEGIIASCIILAGIIGMAFSVIPNVNDDMRLSSTVKKSKVLNQSKIQVYTKDTVNKTQVANDKNNKELNNDNNDSDDISTLLQEISQKNNVSEDIQKELEVALSDLNSDMNVEILKGIKGAMKEMDLNVIVGEALKGAREAVKNIDVKVIVHEAMKDARNDNDNVDHDIIAEEALKGAEAALNNMDLNKIVNEAMKGVDGALKEMDLNKLIQESLNDDKDNVSRDHSDRSGNKYTDIIINGSEEWNKWREENNQIIPNLSNLKIEDTKLPKASLSGMLLKRTTFSNSDLSEASFKEANVNNAEFYDVILEKTNFLDAQVTNCKFRDCPMKKVSFENSNLCNSVFDDCNLEGSDFRKADIRGTSFNECNLNDCTFMGAIADENTRFPEGFDAKAQGINFQE